MDQNLVVYRERIFADRIPCEKVIQMNTEFCLVFTRGVLVVNIDLRAVWLLHHVLRAIGRVFNAFI